MIFEIVIFALIVSSFIFFLLLGTPLRTFGLDHPNSRSMHSNPVPRTGGLGVLVGLSACLQLLTNQEQILLLLVLGLGVISACDDLFKLGILVRLLAQLIAAISAIKVLQIDYPLTIVVAITLYMVWHANLFNFMDGLDGLAGAMAFVGFAALGVAAVISDTFSIAIIAFVLIATLVPFLALNFNPARIFMGDMGAISIGFLASVLGVWGWSVDAWPIFFPVLVFAPFILDASITLISRLSQGKNIFVAHREHYYQKWVNAGVSIKLVWLYYLLAMIVCATTAVLIIEMPFPVQVLAIVLSLVFLFTSSIILDRKLKI